MQIRPYQPSDADALYDICLRTGAGGADATDLYRDPRLLGELYVGPYVRFAPTLAFVVDGDLGVSGYVLGALDTTSFDQECERSWWPELRRRYPEGTFPAGSPDARLVGLIHRPPKPTPAVVAEFPSHLHIDLLPRTQGRGLGRLLMQRLFDALRSAGSPGVHLGVGTANVRAIGFYARLGFDVVVRHPEHLVMAMHL
ncbi:MAG TPA: GNAT family N-acetyltransferase [Jiangellaceae bacterium]|nr:GNAT family N-acetyltransferase [Jiangellaceae bacterium]